MINYIIESAIIWTGLYLAYRLLLVRETFFLANRIFLLLSLLAGLVIPLIEIPLGSSNLILSYTLEPLNLTSSSGAVEVENAITGFSPVFIAGFIYLAGVIFFLVRFFLSSYHLVHLFKQGEKQKAELYTLVKTEEVKTPFSFFSFLFVPGKLIGEPGWQSILRHELVHIRQWHSIDILTVEILRILFWFNPLLWIYRKEISQNHEYLADQYGMAGSDRRSYSELLLHFSSADGQFSLVNTFNYSPLKNRIKMIYRKKSDMWHSLKYLLLIPVIGLFMILFACQNEQGVKTGADSFTATEGSTEDAVKNDQVFQVVEEMPVFPGCEDLADREEKTKCSNQSLMKYIFTQLKYPEEARKKGTEGRVIASFVILENGTVDDIKIKEDLGDGCGDEVLRVIESMNSMENRWIPGKQSGDPVKVEMTLPVAFRLE